LFQDTYAFWPKSKRPKKKYVCWVEKKHSNRGSVDRGLWIGGAAASAALCGLGCWACNWLLTWFYHTQATKARDKARRTPTARRQSVGSGAAKRPPVVPPPVPPPYRLGRSNSARNENESERQSQAWVARELDQAFWVALTRVSLAFSLFFVIFYEQILSCMCFFFLYFSHFFDNTITRKVSASWLPASVCQFVNLHQLAQFVSGPWPGLEPVLFLRFSFSLYSRLSGLTQPPAAAHLEDAF